MKKHNTIEVLLECGCSTHLLEEGQACKDGIQIVKNLDIFKSIKSLQGKEDEITITFIVDREKMKICGIDSLKDCILRVTDSPKTASRTVLAVCE